MKNQKLFAALAAALLLTGCGEKNSSQSAADDNDMQYIKTSVLYDTLMQMYSAPDDFLGKKFHMVGTLYPSTSDGESFYSIYAKPSGGGEGIGLELEWDDFSGMQDYDTVTVEGTLKKEKSEHDGNQIEYLVLQVSSIEKRK